MPPNVPHRIRNIDLTTSCKYLIFVSSSGHCSLDCSYCIVNPIAKHEATLNFADLEFLLDTLPGKPFLTFSGKGDFFAGYKKNERMLERLLERDVEIALDINGVMIHEFPELPASSLDKIRLINLTMHYRHVLDKRALQAWKENALCLIQRKGGANFLAGYILSPAERSFWREALDFYDSNIFSATGQHLVLIKDIRNSFDAECEAYARELAREYAHMVEEIHEEDFASQFARHSHVLCPAGNTYFRIWNDGKIQGCPYIPELSDCGNLKQRVFAPKPGLFKCTEARHCDCNNIALTGKMIFPDE